MWNLMFGKLLAAPNSAGFTSYVLLSQLLPGILWCGVIAVLGCANDSSVSDVPLSQEFSHGSLEHLLELVSSGRTEEACELIIEEGEPLSVGKDVVEFNVTEREFANLSKSKKNEIQERSIERVGQLKEFARSLKSRANEASRQGDEESALAYKEAINKLADLLSGNDMLTVFRQTGKSFRLLMNQ